MAPQPLSQSLALLVALVVSLGGTGTRPASAAVPPFFLRPPRSPPPAVLPPPSSPAIVPAPVLVPAPLNSAGPSGWPRPPADDRFMLKFRPGRAIFQTTLGLLGGTAWYWRNLDFNSVDWDLRWDGPSWRRKLLGFDAWRFDTNYFLTNARDHSRVGGIYYLVGRANGLDVTQSLVFDFTASLVWEYVVEFKELVSINDMIVNTMAGPSIGEPLLQVGRFFRRGRPTLLNRTLAFVFSPFEWLTGWLDKRPWPGDDATDENGFTVERGHRFRFFTALRAVNFEPGVGRGDTTLGLDMEVMMQRGFGQPGRWAGWIKPGDFSHVTLTFTLGENFTWLGSVFRTQTSLFGFYRQRLVPDGFGGRDRRGYGLLFGAGSRFDFETRRLAREDDRLAVVSVLGPQLDWTVYAGEVVFRWATAAYGDFGMVDSYALGPETLPDPTPPLSSVLRVQGYYYGYGATGLTRARLDLWAWTLEAEVRAHHLISIDRAHRLESELDSAFKDLTDDRVIGLAKVSFRPWKRALGFAGFFEAVGRRGTRAEVTRSGRELSVGGQLLLAL